MTKTKQQSEKALEDWERGRAAEEPGSDSQERSESRESWKLERDMETSREKLIIIDVDGVIRNLDEPLCARAGVDYPPTDVEVWKSLYQKTLAGMRAEDVKYLYATAISYERDTTAQAVLEMSQHPKITVWLATAAYFSNSSREGTDLFLNRNNLSHLLRCKADTTAEKIKWIQNVCSEMELLENYDIIVIDDYRGVLTEIPPTVRRVQVKHTKWEEKPIVGCERLPWIEGIDFWN